MLSPTESFATQRPILLAGINGRKLEAKDHQNIANYQQKITEDSPANNQIKQAKEFYQQGEYDQAITLLKTAIKQGEKTENILLQSQGLLNLSLIYLIQSNWTETETNINQLFPLIKKINNLAYRNKLTNYALEIKGELELAIGQPEKALNTWGKSGEIAYNRGDIKLFIHGKIKQILALQELGMYGEAVQILEQIQPQLATVAQDLVTAQAWLTLGKIFFKLGQLESAKESLERALNIAQKYQNSELISSIILAQGHLSLSQNRIKIQKLNQPNYQYLQETRNYYQQAAAITNNPSFQINAQLSELNLLVSYNQPNISDNFI